MKKVSRRGSPCAFAASAPKQSCAHNKTSGGFQLEGIESYLLST